MKEALDFVLSMEFWRMGLRWTLSLLISYWHLLFASTTTPPSRSLPPSSPSRPVCIITGATSGLGAAAAHALSARGFFVVLVGRSSRLLEKTMMEIKRKNESAQLKAFEVDLSSFQSILQFKASLQQWLSDLQMHSSIQLLINNAGILATSSRFTSEGYDQMMATNYLSAFFLIKLLLPLLRNSLIPSRIVNVTSFTHRSVTNIQFAKDTVSGKCFSRLKRYPYAHVYEYSKLFLLLFSYELHRQLGLMDISRHVSVIAVDPGVVETNILREVPPCLSSLANKVLRSLWFLQSPEVGISSILDAAFAPPETSGVYFFGGKGNTVSSSMLSYDAKLAQELWSASSDLFLESQLAFKETSTSVSNFVSRSVLIAVAAVMLFLAVIGLFLSVLRHQHAIHIFIVSGWLLVAITFILCGAFVILNNAVSDTCMAMEEWVENPHAETALSNVLPCVDQKTTNQTLSQSKGIINDMVTVVNTFIYTYANTYPSHSDPYYYNQSGPLMPALCYPYDSELRDTQCGDQQVSITNASLVWQNYTCEVSASGMCITPGRVKPEIYTQLVAAVNESYALQHFTPPLLSIQDCNFVRDTFRTITSSYCPPLDHYLKIVNAGLALISVGVLLCLLLWVLYANRPQREEAFAKQSLPVKDKSMKSSSNNHSHNSSSDVTSNISNGV